MGYGFAFPKLARSFCLVAMSWLFSSSAWAQCTLTPAEQGAYFGNSSCFVSCFHKSSHDQAYDRPQCEKDCDRIRDGHKAQGCFSEYQEAGAKKPTTKSCNWENCHTGAQAEAEGGAAATAKERGVMEKGTQEGGSIREQRIASAEEILQRWEKGRGGVQKMPPAERAAFQRDSALVKQARTSFKNDETFSHVLAAKATDPGIRRELTVAAAANELKLGSEMEGFRLAQQELKLREIAETNAARAAKLSSVKATAAEKKIATEEDSTKPKLAAKKEEVASTKGESSKAAEVDIDSNSSIDAPLVDPVTGKKLTAKERAEYAALRKRLKDKGSKALKPEEEALKAFGGDLEEGRHVGNEKEVAVENSPILAAAGEAFTLAGAETEAEVKRLRAEAERLQAESDAQQGILGAESPSLFERVHEAHNACLRRKCVNTVF